MLRHHNDGKTRAVLRKGKEGKEIVTGDVVITPLEAEMLAVLLKAVGEPAIMTGQTPLAQGKKTPVLGA